MIRPVGYEYVRANQYSHFVGPDNAGLYNANNDDEIAYFTVR